MGVAVVVDKVRQGRHDRPTLADGLLRSFWKCGKAEIISAVFLCRNRAPFLYPKAILESLLSQQISGTVHQNRVYANIASGGCACLLDEPQWIQRS